jgi:hypothetical protein
MKLNYERGITLAQTTRSSFSARSIPSRSRPKLGYQSQESPELGAGIKNPARVCAASTERKARCDSEGRPAAEAEGVKLSLEIRSPRHLPPGGIGVSFLRSEGKCRRVVFAVSWRMRLELADQIAAKSGLEADAITDTDVLAVLDSLLSNASREEDARGAAVITAQLHQATRDDVASNLQKGGAAA